MLKSIIIISIIISVLVGITFWNIKAFKETNTSGVEFSETKESEETKFGPRRED